MKMKKKNVLPLMLGICMAMFTSCGVAGNGPPNEFKGDVVSLGQRDNVVLLTEATPVFAYEFTMQELGARDYCYMSDKVKTNLQDAVAIASGYASVGKVMDVGWSGENLLTIKNKKGNADDADWTDFKGFKKENSNCAGIGFLREHERDNWCLKYIGGFHPYNC